MSVEFRKDECELYLKQPLTSPQCKTIVAYHTLNHRLAIETGEWPRVASSRDYLTFAIIMRFKMRHSVFKCPFYNPMRDKFPSLLIIIIRKPQVFLSIAPASWLQALCHGGHHTPLHGITRSRTKLQSHKPLTSRISKSNSFHLIGNTNYCT